MKIAIIGGGIGGMALALSLHAAGIKDVDVYESAPAIRELGVGINLLPGELLGVLYRAVVERLGSHRVHPDHHLIRFGQEPPGHGWGEFVDRATEAPVGRVEADLLVGCDGIPRKGHRSGTASPCGGG